MARIINSADLGPLSAADSGRVYNSLDAALTFEISEKQDEILKPEALASYSFVFGMQGPALTLMRRGILIDQDKRQEVYERLSAKLALLLWAFESITEEVCGKKIAVNSHQQIKDLFYKYMKIPEITVFDYASKKKKVSVGREALEQIQSYYWAAPIAKLILAIRDIGKKLAVVKSGASADGRMRCSYHVAGTETGRWSSSKNVWGGGTNNQNITDEMREMFIPDEGMKLAYLDLEQAESKVVAMVSGDPQYIAACESGDLHTYVCRLIWRDKPWTDDQKKNKEIAEQIFYRHFTFRDMAKRGGHAKNYYAKNPTIAHHLKLSRQVADDFGNGYYRAFPGIPAWHMRVAQRIASKHEITTILGRQRFFFGRWTDDATIRKAIAFEPQSVVGEILNIGLYRIWRNLDSVFGGTVEVLGQVHDAILLQYPDPLEMTTLPECLRLMRVKVETPSGILEIPTEASVGWNWRKKTKTKTGEIINPWGLQKFDGTPERRTRPERRKITSLLDRLVRSGH